MARTPRRYCPVSQCLVRDRRHQTKKTLLLAATWWEHGHVNDMSYAKTVRKNSKRKTPRIEIENDPTLAENRENGIGCNIMLPAAAKIVRQKCLRQYYYYLPKRPDGIRLKFTIFQSIQPLSRAKSQRTGEFSSDESLAMRRLIILFLHFIVDGRTPKQTDEKILTTDRRTTLRVRG